MAGELKLKSIAPQFVVTDVVRTAEYYRDQLGFKILGYFADPPVYAMVGRDNVEIHFGKGDPDKMLPNERLRKGLGNDVYIWVTDIQAMFEELLTKDVEIVEGPVKRIYESTEVVVRDCNGYQLVFAD
ncbi:MAG TPA: VOC family protein [Pyrinomonadaceae bacterium]|nr:VOC family protein [Pyrinomonadaceae bacterium]